MGYKQKEMASGWAPRGRFATMLSHRWFKAILITTMVILLTLVLALSLLIPRVKSQSQPESQNQVEGQGTNSSGITLTVSTDGGNASSPLLYGIMFEVRHIASVPFIQTVKSSSLTNRLL